jgi:hypothetical protein
VGADCSTEAKIEECAAGLHQALRGLARPGLKGVVEVTPVGGCGGRSGTTGNGGPRVASLGEHVGETLGEASGGSDPYSAPRSAHQGAEADVEPVRGSTRFPGINISASREIYIYIYIYI